MLNFPDFTGSHCFYFEACGRLRNAKRQRERLEKIARIRISGRNAYLRLVWGGEMAGHFHVDLAFARSFPGNRPKFNSTRREIEKKVAQRFGEAIEIIAFGQYMISSKYLVPGSGVVFVGPNAVVSTVNNTPVEVGGAHLVFRSEGFVRTIDWQIHKEDTVFADIVGRLSTEVSPSYLTDAFDRLEKSFGTYIVGRSSDVSLST